MELKKEKLEQVGGSDVTEIDGMSVHCAGWRYYCDFCNKSWFFEGGLNPNLSSFLWEEISEEEYLKKSFAANE